MGLRRERECRVWVNRQSGERTLKSVKRNRDVRGRISGRVGGLKTRQREGRVSGGESVSPKDSFRVVQGGLCDPRGDSGSFSDLKN